MKEILEHLYLHKTLSKAEAKTILIDIASGKYNLYQTASFLTAFIMRNITLDELKGFREALLELCHRVNLSEYNAMDVCGTGGDGKNTFNISTLSSFVVAGAGIPVAKHGNYGVSSVSGSSNVLEQSGIRFQAEEKKLNEQLDKANICFLHAPQYHPAMKFVAPIRKELGVKTFFNMLGPLVNPAQPNIQLVGVFSLELARMYQYLFQEEQMQYTIIHSLDGFDEVSLTDECKLISNNDEQIVKPDYFGFDAVSLEAIHGGKTVEEAAEIFSMILRGEGTKAQNEVVLANAALAIQTYKKIEIMDAIEKAKDSLFGLKALQSFNALKRLA
ncbi:MAG: anthranilate phosphoribosyltransferase [Bacteroidetes bacterium GWF2_40_14]|nr:MAG: anthranilate phosphoribosyltransferase [Bacteroidetes bacterium GWF2_40_14]